MPSLWDIWQLWNFTCFFTGAVLQPHLVMCTYLRKQRVWVWYTFHIILQRANTKLMKAPFFWQDEKSILTWWQIYFGGMENLFWQIGKSKALPTSLWPPSPSWLQSSCSLAQKRINKIEYNRLYPFTGFCQWFFCYQQLSCIYSIINSLKVCPDHAPLSKDNLKWWPFFEGRAECVNRFGETKSLPNKVKTPRFPGWPIDVSDQLNLWTALGSHLLAPLADSLASAAIGPKNESFHQRLVPNGPSLHREIPFLHRTVDFNIWKTHSPQSIKQECKTALSSQYQALFLSFCIFCIFVFLFFFFFFLAVQVKAHKK